MSDQPISKVDVSLSMDWGVKGIDYVYKSSYTDNKHRQCDLQNLLIDVSLHRAKRVEAEIEPLATRIANRNDTLDSLGNALADLTKLQAMFDSEADGDDRKGTLQQTSYDTLREVFGSLDFSNRKMTKYEVEEWLQKVKSRIDGLKNQAQKDMSRLESLVNRRDEAFSTASDIMGKVSDTRSNLITNLS